VGSDWRIVGVILAERSRIFLTRLKEIIQDKQWNKLVVECAKHGRQLWAGALKVQEFVAVLKDSVAMPIKLWDERRRPRRRTVF